MANDLPEELTSAPANVLSLSSSFHPHGERFFNDRLAARDANQTALLIVTNRGSVDECLRRWTHSADPAPSRLGIVAMGESTRSAAATGVQSFETTKLSLETIAHPGDLTGAGIEISEQLEAWSGKNEQIVACVDSLTVLLQYESIEKVYQFLHVLTHQMHAADVIAHYYMDASAHDDVTVNTLLPLFDFVVEFDADGTESIRSR